MEIPKDLSNDIWDFCRNNNITNIDDFTLKLLKQGFTSEKFGSTPMITTKEKIVEKIVEVPVEKIVEKIIEKEVPVEKIIEKEIYITDDAEVNKLTIKMEDLTNQLNDCGKEFDRKEDEIKNLRKEISELKSELENERNKRRPDIYGE